MLKNTFSKHKDFDNVVLKEKVRGKERKGSGGYRMLFLCIRKYKKNKYIHSKKIKNKKKKKKATTEKSKKVIMTIQ